MGNIKKKCNKRKFDNFMSNMGSYKLLFYRWLKENDYYDFYCNCYRTFYGDLDFSVVIVNRLNELNFIRYRHESYHSNYKNIINDFVSLSLSYHNDSPMFKDDDSYDILFSLGMNWEIYVENHNILLK